MACDVGDHVVDVGLRAVAAERQHRHAQVAEPLLQLLDDAGLLDAEVEADGLAFRAVPAIDRLQPPPRRGRTGERLVAVDRPAAIHQRRERAGAPRLGRVPRQRLVRVRRVRQQLRGDEPVEQLPQRDERVVALDDGRGLLEQCRPVGPVRHVADRRRHAHTFAPSIATATSAGMGSRQARRQAERAAPATRKPHSRHVSPHEKHMPD